MVTSKCITPFLVQCFVTAGVSINMAGSGLVMGFSTVLLPQLKLPSSEITIDDSSGSWIAAIPGIGVFAGNVIIPPIMAHFGRKIANLTCLAITIIGWTGIFLASNVPLLIGIRYLQGLAMGMISALGPVMIGEYTSPKNRGAFLMTISISISVGVLAIHTMGSYLSWETTALICVGVTAIDIIIVLCSPESPTFLADKGKYEECRLVFRYLRGSDEDDELEKMILVSTIVRKEKNENLNQTMIEKLVMNIKHLRTTITKKEFYKPILIMAHLYTMGQWSGVNLLVAYTVDLFDQVVGPNIDMAVMIIAVDINRIVSSIIGLIIIRYVRRRVLLFATVGLNIVICVIISIYTFAQHKNWLIFDNPYVGILLLHLLMFTVATGAQSLSFVLAGELFPMEYKSLCGGISSLFFSLNLFLGVKSVPFLFKTVNVYGLFGVLAGVLVYSIVIVGIMLPETKDRTLQDIEEKFRGKRFSTSRETVG